MSERMSTFTPDIDVLVLNRLVFPDKITAKFVEHVERIQSNIWLHQSEMVPYKSVLRMEIAWIRKVTPL